MTPKSNVDAFGAICLISFSLLLAFNQVVIKVTNGGLQPVFFAGLRSAGAVVCIYLWMRFRGHRPDFTHLRLGLGIGVVFALEFLCLFNALDLTTVARTSVIFYTMPFWLSVGAWIWLGESLGALKIAGLLAAILGVAVALLDDTSGGSLAGDLYALGGSVGWAAIALLARGTRLREVHPEMQLFWQVLVSAPILLLLAPLFGPLVRDLEPIHLWGLGFQTVVVVSAGFIFWLWLLSIYPASQVGSFSFLSPIFTVGLGWLLLGEPVSGALGLALGLVVLGLLLVNWPRRRS